MENFGILLEQMGNLRFQFQQENKKKKPNKRLLIDLESRVKTLKGRIDKFGCRYSIIRVDLRVKDKEGIVILQSMYVTGLDTISLEDMRAWLKWKCKQQDVEFLDIVGEATIGTGKLRGYQK
jgi:hypothetical protein